MNRLREKTTATILIALFMISAFAVAMPAMAETNYDYGFQINPPNAEVDLSTEQAHDSLWSVKQVINDGTSDTDARVKFNYYGTLDSIESVSYFAINAVGMGPYVTMSIDRDGVDGADAWLVRSSITYTNQVDWEQQTFNDLTMVALAHSQTGGPYVEEFWLIPPTEAIPLAEFKDLPVNTDGKTWGDCIVEEIKVGIGTGGGTYSATAFVDDVIITGYTTEPTSRTYDFESGAITMTVTATVPKIGIIVDDTSLDFGSVILGRTTITDKQLVTITSTSEAHVTVTPKLEFDPSGFYAECLEMSRPLDVGIGLPELGSFGINFWLNVPRTQEPGTYLGTLIFWVEETSQM